MSHIFLSLCKFRENHWNTMLRINLVKKQEIGFCKSLGLVNLSDLFDLRLKQGDLYSISSVKIGNQWMMGSILYGL